MHADESLPCGRVVWGGSSAAVAGDPSADGGPDRLACTNGGVKVYGWVRDTATDGRCATVTASSDGGPGWIDMVEACGSGVRENFDWFIPGTRSAQVILRIHDTD